MTCRPEREVTGAFEGKPRLCAAVDGLHMPGVGRIGSCIPVEIPVECCQDA